MCQTVLKWYFAEKNWDFKFFWPNQVMRQIINIYSKRPSTFWKNCRRSFWYSFNFNKIHSHFFHTLLYSKAPYSFSLWKEINPNKVATIIVIIILQVLTLSIFIFRFIFTKNLHIYFLCNYTLFKLSFQFRSTEQYRKFYQSH